MDATSCFGMFVFCFFEAMCEKHGCIIEKIQQMFEKILKIQQIKHIPLKFALKFQGKLQTTFEVCFEVSR